MMPIRDPSSGPAVSAFRHHRGRRRALSEITASHMKLDGLTVLTEAASGPFIWTPVIAGLAGAEHVVAMTGSSRWGSAETIASDTAELWRAVGLDPKRLEIRTDRSPDTIAQADIVTNLGHVRPIDTDRVRHMKPTAAISLMWETWEFRESDLDVRACAARGIPVIGTDEHRIGYLDLSSYAAWQVLATNGIELPMARLLVVCSAPLIASYLRVFEATGVPFTWTSRSMPEPRHDSPRYRSPDDRGGLIAALADADALLVDERLTDATIVGLDGLITPDEIAEINPGLLVAVRAGTVDFDALAARGIALVPDRPPKKGHVSFPASILGDGTVIRLHAAGLKVGEVATRALRAGQSPASAINAAVRDAPGMVLPQWFEAANLPCPPLPMRS